MAWGIVPFDLAASQCRSCTWSAGGHGGPKTFTEKLQFKVAHDRRPLLRVYADKIAVRDYVRWILPSLRQPKLLSVCSTADEAVRQIPVGQPWVMKASHGSSMVLVCGRSGLVTRADARRHARCWLATDYALQYWEWQYYRLPRRVMFEELLGGGPEVPSDYKFYVFNQHVRLVSVDQGRFRRHTLDFLRPDWTLIESEVGPHPRASLPPRKPAQLQEMIRIAETLACESDFLRVDLYEVGGEIYFGELTSTPGAGCIYFEDRALDEEIGSYWKQPARYQ